MNTVSEAVGMIVAAVVTGSCETVSPSDAWRRVLALDLSAPQDSPPFDKSLMDGFAVSLRAFEGGNGSTAGGASHVRLEVTETVTAGQTPTRSVTSTTAIRIMTGAPLPAGADCVVPIERTEFSEAVPDTVVIGREVPRTEDCILRRGAAARVGDPLLKSGTILEPRHIAALAEFGVAQVPVRRLPTVAVLTTGNELVEVDQPVGPGQIRNSNQPMLETLVQEAYGISVSLGIARDQADELRAGIQQGLQHDFLLLSGGVSAGTLDLVPSQLAAAGVRQIFHGVNMKPGKPLWFGVWQGQGRDGQGHQCWIFGLPGNPVSSLACFELFVRTGLRKFLGIPHPEPTPLPGRLTVPMQVRGSRPVYHPAAIVRDVSGLHVSPIHWSGSADLRATIDANGMVLLHPEVGSYPAGAVVDTFGWTPV